MSDSFSFFKRGNFTCLSVSEPGYYTVTVEGYINKNCISTDSTIIGFKKGRFNGEIYDDKYIMDDYGIEGIFNEIATKTKRYKVSDSLNAADEAFATALKIPSVSCIDDGFLSDALYIQTLILPDDGSLLSIGSQAFMNCMNLTSIVIPDSVEYIGPSAFMNCNAACYISYSEKTILCGDVFKNFGVTPVSRDAEAVLSSMSSGALFKSIADLADDGNGNLILTEDEDENPEDGEDYRDKDEDGESTESEDSAAEITTDDIQGEGDEDDYVLDEDEDAYKSENWPVDAVPEAQELDSLDVDNLSAVSADLGNAVHEFCSIQTVYGKEQILHEDGTNDVLTIDEKSVDEAKVVNVYWPHFEVADRIAELVATITKSDTAFSELLSKVKDGIFNWLDDKDELNALNDKNTNFLKYLYNLIGRVGLGMLLTKDKTLSACSQLSAAEFIESNVDTITEYSKKELTEYFKGAIDPFWNSITKYVKMEGQTGNPWAIQFKNFYKNAIKNVGLKYKNDVEQAYKKNNNHWYSFLTNSWDALVNTIDTTFDSKFGIPTAFTQAFIASLDAEVRSCFSSIFGKSGYWDTDDGKLVKTHVDSDMDFLNSYGTEAVRIWEECKKIASSWDGLIKYSPTISIICSQGTAVSNNQVIVKYKKHYQVNCDKNGNIIEDSNSSSSNTVKSRMLGTQIDYYQITCTNCGKTYTASSKVNVCSNCGTTNYYNENNKGGSTTSVTGHKCPLGKTSGCCLLDYKQPDPACSYLTCVCSCMYPPPSDPEACLICLSGYEDNYTFDNYKEAYQELYDETPTKEDWHNNDHKKLSATYVKCNTDNIKDEDIIAASAMYSIQDSYQKTYADAETLPKFMKTVELFRVGDWSAEKEFKFTAKIINELSVNAKEYENVVKTDHKWVPTLSVETMITNQFKAASDNKPNWCPGPVVITKADFLTEM